MHHNNRVTRKFCTYSYTNASITCNAVCMCKQPFSANSSQTCLSCSSNTTQTHLSIIREH